MKKIYLLLILLISFTSVSIAQKGGRVETVEAIKIAFFTKKLSLSPEEAQKFWPIYNQYFEEIRQVRQQNRTLDEIDIEEKTVAVRRKYKDEFAKALSAEKVNQFFKVDKEFTLFLRKELQERKQRNQD